MDYESYKQKRLSGLDPSEAYEGDDGFSVGRTIGNIPKSAGEFLGGIVGAVAHPIKTVKSLGAVAAGAVEKLVPGEQAEEQYFDSLVDFYKDRYSSFDDFLSTLEQDPVGVLSDASVVLTGGGAIASKLGSLSRVGGLSRAGTVAARAGASVNPLTAVGKLSTSVQSMFPALAKKIEKSNLRLTKTKEGAMSTKGLEIGEGAIDITKNRLNEVSEFLTRQKFIGNPLERYAKATKAYQKTEDALEGFFNSFSKSSTIQQDRVVRALNGLKSYYKGHRDVESISKQIDGAINATKRAATNGEISYGTLNKLKRTTYENAYNKAGEKVVDGVEHSIGDLFLGLLDEDVRGLKIAGQSFEQFRHNYGLLIEGRKLLKLAVGKPEISALTERMLGGLAGYLIGGMTTLGSPVGTLGGLAIGKSLFEALPVTKLKSLSGAISQKLGDVKLPSVVKKTKIPVTAVERIQQSQ